MHISTNAMCTRLNLFPRLSHLERKQKTYTRRHVWEALNMLNLSWACSKSPRHAYQRRFWLSFPGAKLQKHVQAYVYRYHTKVLTICARLALLDAEASSGVLIVTLH